jgi:tyrosyl-tRNA synthetase
VPERRDAQRVLAREVTTIVHGREPAEKAERGAALIFGEDITTLDPADVLAMFDDLPSMELPAELFADGVAIADLLVRAGVAPSKSEARRLVQSGGAYVNNRRIADPQVRVSRGDAIGGEILLVRKGQREQRIVRVVGP